MTRRDNPGIRIAGTLEYFARISTIHEGRLGDDGRIDFDTYGDATIVTEHPQAAPLSQQRIFLDEYGAEVLEADVVLLMEPGMLLFPFHPWRRHA